MRLRLDGGCPAVRQHAEERNRLTHLNSVARRVELLPHRAMEGVNRLQRYLVIAQRRGNLLIGWGLQPVEQQGQPLLDVERGEAQVALRLLRREPLEQADGEVKRACLQLRLVGGRCRRRLRLGLRRLCIGVRVVSHRTATCQPQ